MIRSDYKLGFRWLAFLVLASAALGQGPAPHFEVVSVRPAPPGELGGRLQLLPGGRLSAQNAPLNYMMQQIFQLKGYQIVGDPQWMAVIADGRDARYYIVAKGDEKATEQQVREMAKAMLADRFHLKYHMETRELPVYALIPAKGGVKVPIAKDDGEPSGSGYVTAWVQGWMAGTNVLVDALVSAIARSVDRPILDRTGFESAFDFRLTWTDSELDTEPRSADGCPASFAQIQEKRQMKLEPLNCESSIFTAVEVQTGFKLDARKAPVEVLVIDHVERPSEN